MLLEMERYDEAYTAAATVNELMEADSPFDMEKDYEVLTLSYRVMGMRGCSRAVTARLPRCISAPACAVMRKITR